MIEGYRLMDHTADFGLEIFGTDPAALFRQAALAISDLVTDPASLKRTHWRTIDVKGDDWADLMVNWLRELLYCWHGEGQLLADVNIDTIGAAHLTAKVAFDDYEPHLHEIRNEIKGVTYHQIEVRPSNDGWMAKVIVDV